MGILHKDLVLLGAFAAILTAADASSPVALLHHAMYLGDLNNWWAAEAEFRRAEAELEKSPHSANLEFARLGIIRSTIQRRNLAETSALLGRQLEANPLFRANHQLRLYCLAIKANIDGEMQSALAKRDWEQVASLAQELEDRKWQYRATAGIGLAAFYSGDVTTARQNVGAALMASIANHDVGAQIMYFYATGYGFFAMKMYDQAIPMFDRAIRLAADTPDAGYPFLVLLAKADTLSVIGKTGEARQLITRTQQEARHRGDRLNEATTLASLAQIDRKNGDPGKAIAELERSGALCRSGGYLRMRIEVELILANLYREQHQLQNAERVLSDVTENEQRNGQLSSLPERLRILAGIQAAQNRIAAADRSYDKAALFVDAAIASDRAIVDKTAWVNEASQLYVEHFSLLAEHHGNPAKLFSIIEQVRGRVLTDVLLGGSTTNETTRGVEIATSKARLALMNSRTTAEASHIRDQLFLLEQARWTTPDLNVLKARTNRLVSLKDVQATISPDSVLLEYVLASPSSYCLVITHEAATVVPLAAKDQIEKAVTEYLAALRSRQDLSSRPASLYQSLLAPAGKAGEKKNLVIVRDGMLHLLPFDSLRGSDGRLLVRKQIVSYLPSGASFALLAAKRSGPKATRSLFAVGGLPYRQQAVQIASADVTRGVGLENIPNSGEEIRVAVRAFDGQKSTLLTGAQATKTAVQRAGLEDYRILHFAVHGEANLKHPDQSALVLLNDTKSGQDALLPATEVSQLHIRADLVVLSACDTAVGPLEGQEGVATLSRSFLLAGARSVISSLWSLDDNFSLALLKQFYESYRTTNDAAESLALAKRAVLAKFGENTPPYYWAAFTFEGVPGTAIAQHVTQR